MTGAWFKLSEKMPDPYKDILFIIEDQLRIFSGTYTKDPELFYINGSDRDFVYKTEIVAWQPIPEIPDWCDPKKLTGPKYFICQSMDGKSKEQINDERHTITKLVNEKFSKAMLFSQTFVYNSAQGMKHPEMLTISRSIKLLAYVDFVVISDGVNASNRRCRMEIFMANVYGIPCYTIDEIKQMKDKEDVQTVNFHNSDNDPISIFNLYNPR